MFLVPADRKLDSHAVRRARSWRKLRFATREEVLELTGLAPGSIPPFGSLFGLPTLCDERLGDNDVINFNAGDHSISVSFAWHRANPLTTAGTLGIDIYTNAWYGWGYSEAEYQKAFPDLVATIRKHAPQAKLIWATITPMRQAGKLDVIAEGTKRVQARNKIAEEIVAREGIAVDDLYGLAKDHPEYWSPDGVHFNAQGVAAQVEQVTKRIAETLP